MVAQSTGQYKSNYDKFLEIEEMMDEAKELMKPYLTALEGRYEYMNVLRKEYSDLSHTLGRIEQRLRRKQEIEVDDDVKSVAKEATSQIEAHIEAIEEDKQQLDNPNTLKRLKHAKRDLEDKIDVDHINTVWQLLKDMRIDIEPVNVLVEYSEAMSSSAEAKAESIVAQISRLRSEYVSSFVTYREAIEQGEDVQKDVDDVIAALEDAGYVKESDDLFDVKPNIAEERGKRPNPEPLLNILKPIRSAGLKYFQSNNNQSESFSLNIDFADEVKYTRRALLEGREFIGTERAFDRLETAFKELSDYMYARFYQLGGEPNNFHGHDSR